MYSRPNHGKARRSLLIKAYVRPDEFEKIMNSANMARLSLSEFMRRVALGTRIESRVDQAAHRELIRVHGDLGRLGGLLKQSIVDNNRMTVNSLLRQIEKRQAELKEKIAVL